MRTAQETAAAIVRLDDRRELKWLERDDVAAQDISLMLSTLHDALFRQMTREGVDEIRIGRHHFHIGGIDPLPILERPADPDDRRIFDEAFAIVEDQWHDDVAIAESDLAFDAAEASQDIPDLAEAVF